MSSVAGGGTRSGTAEGALGSGPAAAPATSQDSRTPARVYALTQRDAQAAPNVVTGILFIAHRQARVLIDPGATHSFVASSVGVHLGRPCEKLKQPLLVSTPVGDVVVVEEFTGIVL